MADTFARRPRVTRFARTKTYPGREIRRTRVVRKQRPLKGGGTYA